MHLPVYKLNGKTYKTVAGLSRAIFADSGCDSHTMVLMPERIIEASVGRKPDERIVARYKVDAPDTTKPYMNVVRVDPMRPGMSRGSLVDHT